MATKDIIKIEEAGELVNDKIENGKDITIKEEVSTFLCGNLKRGRKVQRDLSSKSKKSAKQTTLLSHFKVKKNNKGNTIKSQITIDKISKDYHFLTHSTSYHDLNDSQISAFKTNLLTWFDNNKRKLPWRFEELATNVVQINNNAYKVWVSEIMLQQTQVDTVKQYFINWMEQFPTIQNLAKAELEQVNKIWAGLGYYQRAKRLHEGAKVVVEKYNGIIPRDLETLLSLPGIGPYTAAAIASIAFNLPCETVDGNITRVLTRVFAISGDIKSKIVTNFIWEKAKLLLDNQRPGDFNQAYMDLGSSICTSSNPKCEVCPFGKNGDKDIICKAYLESQIHLTDILDIESLNVDLKGEKECLHCIEPSPEKRGTFEVTRYPFKSAAKKRREEECVVLIISQEDSSNTKKYLLAKRAEKGLLAGLWAFPNVDIKTNIKREKENELVLNSDIQHLFELKVIIQKYIKDINIQQFLPSIKYHGQVAHIFSHINQIYHVYSIVLNQVDFKDEINRKWVDHPTQLSIPTAFNKVWKKFQIK